jgi:hypothetical protein
MRNAHKPCSSKFEGKRLIGGLGVCIKNNIKMDHLDACCGINCPLAVFGYVISRRMYNYDI